MIDKKDMEWLAQYEQQLYTATKANYARGVTCQMLTRMRDIIKSATGKDMPLNCSCSHCALAIVKAMGQEYYKEKENLAKRAKDFVEVLDEIFNEVPDEPETPKKKATTKATSKPKATKKK